MVSCGREVHITLDSDLSTSSSAYPALGPPVASCAVPRGSQKKDGVDSTYDLFG